jgi:hypothetical protein
MESFDEFCKNILIVMTTFNRGDVTKLALENIDASRLNARLMVLDDHSTEFSLDDLKSWTRSSGVLRLPSKLGINHLRVVAHRIAESGNLKYIYHIDNDAIHDPDWLYRLYDMRKKFRGCLGLYNTAHHFMRTIQEYNDVVLRTSCAGISLFYDVADIKKVPETFNNSWDFVFGDILGHTFVSKVSFVEHLGAGGIHNKDFERDRAHNPTPWLVKERERLLKILKK